MGVLSEGLARRITAVMTTDFSPSANSCAFGSVAVKPTAFNFSSARTARAIASSASSSLPMGSVNDALKAPKYPVTHTWGIMTAVSIVNSPSPSHI
jgi:hypothetical protein